MAHTLSNQQTCSPATAGAAEFGSDCCQTTDVASHTDFCEQVWAVWQEHAESLRSFMRHKTRGQAFGEDLLSEVLLKVYKNCGRLAEVKDMRAWLTRIAQNALADHYRKPKTLELPPQELLPAATDATMLPEQRLASCLGELLQLLPEADRLPLQWADLEGMPQEQVAQRLGMSLSGAKSRIQRARIKLKQQIEACCQVETDAQGRVEDFFSKKNQKSC